MADDRQRRDPRRRPGGEGVDQRLDVLFDQHELYRVFPRDLQAAVAANARQQVGAIVGHPLRTRIKDQIVQLGDAQQFLSTTPMAVAATAG
jgi:hypothetical protein